MELKSSQKVFFLLNGVYSLYVWTSLLSLNGYFFENTRSVNISIEYSTTYYLFGLIALLLGSFALNVKSFFKFSKILFFMIYFFFHLIYFVYELFESKI